MSIGTTSKAKAIAARENGKRGGRPKTQPDLFLEGARALTLVCDSFGMPLTENQLLLLEMANIPSSVHRFGVDVKLQLLQPGKRIYQHAERVKVFRGSNPNDQELSFVLTLREYPSEIDFFEGKIFLSSKEYKKVLEGVRKYRLAFIVFWYSPGMTQDDVRNLMDQIDKGTLKEIPEDIRKKM